MILSFSFVLLVSGGLLIAMPQYCCVGRGYRCALYKENITNCLSRSLALSLSEWCWQLIECGPCYHRLRSYWVISCHKVRCPVKGCDWENQLQRVLAQICDLHQLGKCLQDFMDEHSLVRCPRCSQWYLRLQQHFSKCSGLSSRRSSNHH